MVSPNAEPAGILHAVAENRKFLLTRHPPSRDLGFFVKRYWIITWDLAGKGPHDQELIPHPCVNIVIQRGQTKIYGVSTAKSSHRIEGRGRVFGVKFRPGAFYPFFKRPVSDITDRAIDVGEVFGVDGEVLEEVVLSLGDKESMIQHVERFLRERLPEPDETVGRINDIVDRIVSDRTITRVDDVVRQVDTTMTKRTLQRLFHRYVGVSPKWVIQRYRLMEAVDRLAGGEDVNWAEMALELGYFDQAHFSKDFKAMIGQSPAEYEKHLGLSRVQSPQ